MIFILILPPSFRTNNLLVRSPFDVARRLRWGDPFIRELLERGKVLYEANDS